METSLGAMLWCQPAERCVTPSEPRCGVGQRDVKLCWCRVAASANRTKNSVGATLWHRPTGHRNLLEPRCGIGQQDVRCMDSVGVVLRHWPTEKVELRWGRVTILASGKMVYIGAVLRHWPTSRR
jgi:hypothetical protein